MPAGSAKKGRSQKKCDAYKAARTFEKNQLLKVLRHVRRQGTCPAVEKHIEALKKILPVADQKIILARFGA